MRRRDFIAVIVGGAAAYPFAAAHGQQATVPVIGFMSSRSFADAAEAVSGFRKGLNETGYVEGQNVAVEYRWGDGQFGPLPAMAADLVARRVSVIVATGGLPASLAAKAATSIIPIVFTLGSDPVTFGLVASLNQPGGNITGVTLFAYLLEGKRLELLHELVPNAARVAVLANPANPQAETEIDNVREAARSIGRQIIALKASTASDYDDVLAAIVSERASALLVSGDPFFLTTRDQLVALAARHRLPTIYGFREFAQSGGLISYGVSVPDAYRQAGVYVGRILKGAKPEALPVMQPTKFELVINLNTARALELSVPPSLLARADEVIE
jgi:putative tryptophan/tyrosine transport system substrate-binding protein